MSYEIPDKPDIDVDDGMIVLENSDGEQFEFDRRWAAQIGTTLRSIADANKPDEEVLE